MSSGGNCSIDNKNSSHLVPNSWMLSCRKQYRKSRRNPVRHHWRQWHGSHRRSSKRSAFREGIGRLSEPCVPPDWPFSWSRNSGSSRSVLMQSSRRAPQNQERNNSLNRTQRLQIVHRINHLYFFDPWPCLRTEIWTRSYFSLESCFSTRKRSWSREFVKVKFWDLNSLLVCHVNPKSSLLHRVEWISAWRTSWKFRCR